MKIQLLLTGALCLSALVGCSNPARDQIEGSVQDNFKAQSLVEWESSKYHPERLFEEWREGLKSSDNPEQFKREICDELLKMESRSLTLFDNEIKEEENQDLLAGCISDLNVKLDTYFADERATIEDPIEEFAGTVSGSKIQFKENVQIRDYSNGYYAVSGDVAPKELVLTFDDGPNATYTPQILKALKDVNAKVMFFHAGKSVRANPETLKMVAADGHIIGTHSVTHRCLGTRVNCARSNGRLLTFKEATDEIKGGHQAVYDVLGWVDPIFRFPFGESSPELKHFLKENQVGEFYWSIDSEDWKAQSNENLLRNTLAQIDKRGRGIVLFHDIQRKTAEIMPTFLREVHKRGFQLVIFKSSDESARYNSKLVKKKLP